MHACMHAAACITEQAMSPARHRCSCLACSPGPGDRASGLFIALMRGGSVRARQGPSGPCTPHPILRAIPTAVLFAAEPRSACTLIPGLLHYERVASEPLNRPALAPRASWRCTLSPHKWAGLILHLCNVLPLPWCLVRRRPSLAAPRVPEAGPPLGPFRA